MGRTLDYAAFMQPVTKADIDAYKRQYNNKSPYSTTLMVIVAGTCLVAAAMLFIVVVQNLGFVNSIPMLAVVTLLLFIFERSRKRLLMRNAMMYKFATSNGIALVKDALNPLYAGMIFDDGHSRIIDEALWFSDGVELGNYSYVTGSGKNSRTHQWGYVKIKLVRKLPHMVLDSKSNNFWKFSNLSEVFRRSQIFDIGGDFSKHFTLYVPEQYKRDALYVFTPDVMAAMIDYGKEFDIEIVDDELFLYANNHFTLDNPELYEKLLRIIDTIRNELIDQTDYYADERIGNRAVDIIAPEGRRLRRDFKWVIIIVMTILLYLTLLTQL